MRRLAALWLLAAGCDAGFEKQSIVLDLRVLAIRSEPAEVVVDFDPAAPTIPDLPPVRLLTLVGDPLGPRPLGYSMTACPETIDRRCDPTLPRLLFAEGTAQGDFEATLQVDVPLLRAALENDEFLGLGGVPVQIELRLRPSGAPVAETVYAAKVVFFSPRVPAGRTANANPTMTLLADGMPFSADVPLRVAPRAEVRLLPVEPAGVREAYQLPTLDGGERSFTENLRYSWLATAGELSDEETGGAVDLFGNVPLLETRWKAPEKEGPVTLWVVQRDERGGTYWMQRSILVTASTQVD